MGKAFDSVSVGRNMSAQFCVCSCSSFTETYALSIRDAAHVSIHVTLIYPLQNQSKYFIGFLKY